MIFGKQREHSAQQWPERIRVLLVSHPHNLKRKKETPMNKFRFTLTALAIMAFTLMIASGVQAQATRTWVSGVGDDVNPCSRTAPCKTFAGAISKTATNGEIDALDPGGFGAVTITKSITIDGSPTGEAGVLNAGTSGVIVNITNAADARKNVTLRGLAINGAGTGLQGISIVSGNTAGVTVHVENCIIEGQNGAPGNGITDARSSGGVLEINNTTIINNTGNGVSVNPSAGSTQINVRIANSRVQHNGGSGLFAGSNVHATVFNSVFTQNVAAGIFAQQTAGGNTDVAVDQCVVAANVNGFQANTANSIIRVSNTTAMHNVTLFVVGGGGQVLSYGNNQAGGAGFGGPVGQT
jgi:hypothetical protein